MCPMRIFLVLLSAIIAFTLAWRNYAKSEGTSIHGGPEEQSEASTTIAESGSQRQIYSKVTSGFWMLVDMASGRYLWKNLRSSAELHGSRTR